MIDVGNGPAIVLVPGIQGRWEWTRPTVDALARRFRVVAFSLCDERRTGFACDLSRGFENYLDQMDAVMDRARLDQAIVIGVSYGGLIATEFAARRPERVSRLVLASALPTDWVPDDRARFYMKSPLLLSPVFAATATGRIHPEVTAALPRVSDRLRFMLAHGLRVTLAPTSPLRLARRVQWAEAFQFADPNLVTAPALVVTGEAALDKVVPVAVSERNLSRLARVDHRVLKRTGHLGIVTRPEKFADVLNSWLRESCDAEAQTRQKEVQAE